MDLLSNDIISCLIIVDPTTVLSLLPYVLYNTPKKLYINALEERDQILNENKGKSGIYIFINKINSKRYVGSAKD